MSGTIPQYPWKEGDPLFASALNGAIANSAAYGPFLPLTGGKLNGQLTVDGPPTAALFTRSETNGGSLTVTPIGMYDALPNTSMAQLECDLNLAQGRGGAYFNPFFAGRFVSTVYNALDMSAVGLMGQVNFAGHGGVGQHAGIQAYANRYNIIPQPTTTVVTTLGAPANWINIADVSAFQYDSQPIQINGTGYIQIGHGGTTGAGTLTVERNIPVSDGTAGHVVTGVNNPQLWGLNINVNDDASNTGVTSSKQTNYILGIELDLTCSGLDDAGPPQFGSPGGVRNMMTLIGFGGTAGNPAEIGDGIILGEAGGSTISWKRCFRVGGAAFSQSAFDTRSARQGASAHAIWLADGHSLAFSTDGAVSLSMNPPDRVLKLAGALGIEYLGVGGGHMIAFSWTGSAINAFVNGTNVGAPLLAPEIAPAITGSRRDGTALASLLKALAGLGLIMDETAA